MNRDYFENIEEQKYCIVFTFKGKTDNWGDIPICKLKMIKGYFKWYRVLYRKIFKKGEYRK